MNVFYRGLQLYLVALALVVALTVIWGTNRFVLGNTTAGTGWPVMAVVAGALVLVAAIIRHRRGSAEGAAGGGPYPWSRRD